jgi:hypothetical protein
MPTITGGPRALRSVCTTWHRRIETLIKSTKQPRQLNKFSYINEVQKADRANST